MLPDFLAGGFIEGDQELPIAGAGPEDDERGDQAKVGARQHEREFLAGQQAPQRLGLSLAGIGFVVLLMFMEVGFNHGALDTGTIFYKKTGDTYGALAVATETLVYLAAVGVRP